MDLVKTLGDPWISADIPDRWVQGIVGGVTVKAYR